MELRLQALQALLPDMLGRLPTMKPQLIAQLASDPQARLLGSHQLQILFQQPAIIGASTAVLLAHMLVISLLTCLVNLLKFILTRSPVLMQRLANALVHLKRVFPRANAALLVARQPALALHVDLASLDAAGQELREMLPGVDVDRRERKGLLLAPVSGNVLLEKVWQGSMWLVYHSLPGVFVWCGIQASHMQAKCDTPA